MKECKKQAAKNVAEPKGVCVPMRQGRGGDERQPNLQHQEHSKLLVNENRNISPRVPCAVQ